MALAAPILNPAQQALQDALGAARTDRPAEESDAWDALDRGDDPTAAG